MALVLATAAVFASTQSSQAGRFGGFPPAEAMALTLAANTHHPVIAIATAMARATVIQKSSDHVHTVTHFGPPYLVKVCIIAS